MHVLSVSEQTDQKNTANPPLQCKKGRCCTHLAMGSMKSHQCPSGLTEPHDSAMGAYILTNTILGVPCYNYGIMGFKTLIELFRPLYYSNLALDAQHPARHIVRNKQNSHSLLKLTDAPSERKARQNPRHPTTY